MAPNISKVNSISITKLKPGIELFPGEERVVKAVDPDNSTDDCTAHSGMGMCKFTFTEN